MIDRALKVFDLVEFVGSGNVASVRKLRGQPGNQTAELRYMKDDGELDFSPFEMRAETVRKLCDLKEVMEHAPQIGRSSKPRGNQGEERRVIYTPLDAWVKKMA